MYTIFSVEYDHCLGNLPKEFLSFELLEGSTFFEIFLHVATAAQFKHQVNRRGWLLDTKELADVPMPYFIENWELLIEKFVKI